MADGLYDPDAPHPRQIAGEALQVGFLRGILKHRGGPAFIADRTFLTAELAAAMRAPCIKRVYDQVVQRFTRHGVLEEHELAVEEFVNLVGPWMLSADGDEKRFYWQVADAENGFQLPLMLGFALVAWHLVGWGEQFYADPNFTAPPTPVRRSAAAIIREQARLALLHPNMLEDDSQIISLAFLTDELAATLRLPFLTRLYVEIKDKFMNEERDEDGFILGFVDAVLEYGKDDPLQPDLARFLTGLRASNTACGVPYEIGIGLVGAYLWSCGETLHRQPS